jgi:predicted ArsR family transcriptional regulator
LEFAKAPNRKTRNRGIIVSGNFLNTTVDEWRTAMESEFSNKCDLGKLLVNGKTITELSTELKMSISTTRRRMDTLIKSGKCEKGWNYRIEKGGKMRPVPVYTLKKGEKNGTK